MADDRLLHLKTFYASLAALEAKLGKARTLAGCSGRLAWPRRGVYFFFEPGEMRSDSGGGSRVVRVGTHALAEGSGTKLWTRLSQHRGLTQGGNHRASIFRLLVGTALMKREGQAVATWGVKSSAPRHIRDQEVPLEAKVSTVIGRMPFLWLGIQDEAGRGSLRGVIERNTIALLSNYGKPPLDPPSPEWLGRCCDRPKVRESGLWNSNHVDEEYDPAVIDLLSGFADVMEVIA
jgi:hypothetical protein